MIQKKKEEENFFQTMENGEEGPANHSGKPRGGSRARPTGRLSDYSEKITSLAGGRDRGGEGPICKGRIGGN